MTKSAPTPLHPPIWLQNQLLLTPHGMFTRKNGTSPLPFSSLNLSLGVGDTSENVAINRQQIKKALDIDILVTSQQVHSNKVFCSDAISEDTEVHGYDALVTGIPGTGLLIQQADCQAILLHDPFKGAIGAIHCGWRGSVLNIIRATVNRMSMEYGSDPVSMRAVISPSLGPCCSEFKNFRKEIPEYLHDYQVKPGYFNFWKMSKDQLMAAGMQEKYIDTVSICTVCNRDFFSYRRAKKQGRQATGRHGSAICLKRQNAG